MLPIVLYFSKIYTIFLVVYLSVIEVLIIVAILVRKDSAVLCYSFSYGKFKFSQGIAKKGFNISCEKVAFVHVEKSEEKDGIDIIMLTTSRLRNKNIRMVDQDFLKKYAYVSHEYKKIKLSYPEEQYYYIVISKGGLIKYRALMDLYKNCVKAKYSVEAIEAIKQWND
jgi:hypothetical protein